MSKVVTSICMQAKKYRFGIAALTMAPFATLKWTRSQVDAGSSQVSRCRLLSSSHLIPMVSQATSVVAEPIFWLVWVHSLLWATLLCRKHLGYEAHHSKCCG